MGSSAMWTGEERLERIRRVDMALCEAGWPNAVDLTDGDLADDRVPPLTVYRAWSLAAGLDWSFDEWVAACLSQRLPTYGSAGWRSYFARHGVEAPTP